VRTRSLARGPLHLRVSAGQLQTTPARTVSKLLLHTQEIRKLIGARAARGYHRAARAVLQGRHRKVAIALAKAKKQHDKREELSGASPSGSSRGASRGNAPERAPLVVLVITPPRRNRCHRDAPRRDECAGDPRSGAPAAVGGLPSRLTARTHAGPRWIAGHVGLSGVVFVFQLGAPFVRAGACIWARGRAVCGARHGVSAAPLAGGLRAAGGGWPLPLGSPPPQEIWDDWWSCLWRAQW